MVNRMISKQDQIWEVSYEYCKSLLLVYEKNNYFFTGNKSWDLMKWNALGNVLISKKAISMWLDNSELKKNTPALNFGGPRNKRCFVADHLYPTKALKNRFKEQFSYNSLNKDEFKYFFDEAAESHQPLVIMGKRNKAVLVSEEDWQAIQETLFLLSVPGMRESIREGMETPIGECDGELDW